MHIGAADIRRLHLAADDAAAGFPVSVLAAFLILLLPYRRTEQIAVASRTIGSEAEAGAKLSAADALAGAPPFAEFARRIAARVRLLPPSPLPAGDHGDAPNAQAAFDILGDAGSPGHQADAGRRIADLHLICRPQADGSIALHWRYDDALFEPATIARLQAHYRHLLAAASRDPALPATELAAADAEELALLRACSGDAAGADQSCSIHVLFERQAALRPDAIAVVAGDRQWTYRELDRRADAIAALLATPDLAAGARIGLCLERSPDLIAALLAILKSGAAYVPLDPGYPFARLAAQSSACRPAAILTTRELARALPPSEARLAFVEDAPAAAEAPRRAAVSGAALAYILFTSGSTGAPRAVAVPHRAVVRLVRGADFAQLDAAQAWLHAAPLAFDASTLEIWGALCNGARLVLLPPGPATLEMIGDTLRRRGVTSAWLTAGLFQLLASERLDDLAGLTQLLTGGDVVPPEAARRVLARFPRLRLVNGYGPTENTTFTCCHAIQPDDLARRSLPIGRPIAGTTVHLLDARGKPCPIGVPGELHCGGAGLALGYWNDPAATAQRFVEHPEFGRLYRTGDLCRRREDGAIEFIGRMDCQVKIRGFRIEPEEVEHALAQCPGVRQCAVALRGSGAADKTLAAFVVAESGAAPPALDELRRAARLLLPEHALPAAYHVVPALPLTASGKVDRNALAELAPSEPAPAAQAAAPRTELERIVLAIWRELLGRAELGIHDNFFDCGGHSLAALTVLARLKARTGIALAALDFFQQPTVAGIALRAQQRLAGAVALQRPANFLVELTAQGRNPPLFVIPGGWGEPNEILVFASLLSHLRADRPTYAIRSRATDPLYIVPRRLERQVDAVLQEMAKLAPDGRLALLCECAASVLALALAARIEAQGGRIEALILLDPGPLANARSIAARALDAAAANADRAVALPHGVAKYLRLLDEAAPQAVASPLHIVLSEGFPDADAVCASWRPVARGTLQAYRVPGSHDSYIRAHAAQCARVLETILGGRG